MFWSVSILLAEATAALLLVCFAMRRHLGGRARLAGTIAITLMALSALVAAAYDLDGPALIEQGGGAIRSQLPFFDQALAKAPADSDAAFRVWVLGDSTHVSRGPARLYMNSALSSLAATRGATDFQIDGFNVPGFNAYDYYFALNALLENPPDLVVIPLNLRSFGSRWYTRGGNVHPVMERYCTWDNIVPAARLSSVRRKIVWPAVALRKLDFRHLDSDGEAFLNGLRIEAADALRTAESVQEDPVDPTAESAALSREERIALFAEEGQRLYAQSIDARHELMPVFEEIDRLAAEHGIGILYYTVQTPDARAMQEKNFSFLRFELTRAPNVRYVEMLDVLQPEDFEMGEHIYDDGFMRVAERLLDEIVKARDDGAWRAALRREAQPGR